MLFLLFHGAAFVFLLKTQRQNFKVHFTFKINYGLESPRFESRKGKMIYLSRTVQRDAGAKQASFFNEQQFFQDLSCG
jgi:hypothetical protein